MRTATVAVVAVFLIGVLGGACHAQKFVRAHDYWIVAGPQAPSPNQAGPQTGTKIKIATGPPTAQSIVQVRIPKSPANATIEMALVEREVCVINAMTGDVLDVKESYFLGVPVVNGVPVTISNGAALALQRVTPTNVWDSNIGGMVRGWRLGR